MEPTRRVVLLQLALLATVHLSLQQNCPDGYEYNGGNGECYKFDIPQENWQTARQRCKESQPLWTVDLAVFNSQDESDFVTGRMKAIGESEGPTKSAWFIGVYNDLATNKMAAVDGSVSKSKPSEVPYMVWSPEETPIEGSIRYATYDVNNQWWYIGDGNAQHRFVCELKLTQTGNCDTANNWRLGPDKQCHKIVKMLALGDWYQGKDTCTENHAELVKITNEEINKFAYQLPPLSTNSRTTDAWTAGKSSTNPDKLGYTWKWTTDNSAVTYTDWRSELDSIINKTEEWDGRCIAYRHQKAASPPAGRWISQYCSLKFATEAEYAWCTRSSYVCLPGWIEQNKVCYQIVAEKYTWDHASAFCKSLKGNVIMPHTNNTIAWLRSEVLAEFASAGISNVWAGLYQPSVGSSYSWADNSVYPQAYWLPGEDTKQMLNRGCARMNADAREPRWTATSCNDVNGFICEVTLGQPMLTVTDPPTPTKRCEVGWTLVNQKWCFLYRATVKAYDSARQDCINLGADLVSLTGYDQQEEVMSTRITSANAEYWTGLQRQNLTDNYAWLPKTAADYKPLTFTNWDDISSSTISDQGLCGIAYTVHAGDKGGRWNMRKCSDTRAYICKKEAKLSAFTTTAKPDADTIKFCGGNGWTTDAFSNFCYQYHEDAKTTWHAAQMVCENNGGNLISLNDPTERLFIQNQISGVFGLSGIWIGLNSLTGSGYYTWTDGSPSAYFNWNTNEPMPIWGSCVAMAKSGKWAMMPCTTDYGFICKKPKNMTSSTTPAPKPTAPPGQSYQCKKGYTLIAGTTKCIALMMKAATFEGAKSACLAEGGTLPTIASLEQNNYLFAQFHNVWTPSWIGLQDTTATSTEMWFKWVDGNVPSWTYWMPNQPSNTQASNGDRQDCVYLDPSYGGRWGDNYCSYTLNGYFCQVPATLAPTVTTATPEGCPNLDDSLPVAAYEGNCYYFNWMHAVPFDFAQFQCSQYRTSNTGAAGNLVSILSQQEQTFLSVELYGHGFDWQFYIGLKGNRNGMSWQGGSTATFYNFAPDVVLTDTTVCATIGGGQEYHGLWYTTACGNANTFICKVPRAGWTAMTTVPTQPMRDETKCSDLYPKDPVVDVGDYCYVLRGSKSYVANVNQQQFVKANNLCKQLGIDGGTLASVQNITINNWIKDLAVNVSFMQHTLWIGLSVGTTGDGFQWSNGEAFYFNNFAAGEPASSSGSTCVFMKEDGMWYTSDCYQQRNYVCMVAKPHVSINSTRPPTFSMHHNASVKCGSGDKWALVDNVCYWLGYNQYKSWYDANNYCQSLNASLTSILDETEQLYLSTFTGALVTSEFTWIGLNELDHDSYKWSDGSVFMFNNWDDGQPNDAFGAQLCVAMRSSTGKWIDEDCTRGFGFICKKWLSGAPVPPTTAPRSGYCPVNFKQVGDRCFMLDTTRLLDQESARNECAKYSKTNKGVFLSSVLSAQEQSFLISLMRNTSAPVWIGLVNKYEQSVFDYKWVSEEQITYSNWAYGQPSASGQVDSDRRCVMMHDSKTQVGRWYEELCSRKLHFACSTYITTDNPVVVDGCKPGFKRSGNSCYQVSSQSTDRSTWDSAMQRCALTNSELLTITDVYDQNFVLSLTSTIAPSQELWIGLRSSSNGVSNWYNGWPVLYTNWQYNQPVIDNRYGCVKMNTSTGKWSTENCNIGLGFVCRDVKTFNDERPADLPSEDIDLPGPCPSVSASSWQTIGSYCYYVNASLGRPFGEQVSHCLSLGVGTAMASVGTERTNMLLVQMIQEQQRMLPRYYDTWVGYLQAGGSFESLDGSPVTYVNWENGVVPDTSGSPDQQCVFINGQTGYWFVQSCSSNLGVICRISKSQAGGSTQTTSTTKQQPQTHTTHHITVTRHVDEPITEAPPADMTWLIVTIVVVVVVLVVLIAGAVYLSRAKPHMMPASVVRLLGGSAGSEALASASTGLENEVYESQSSADKPSTSGIEGPATSEGGTI